MSPSVLPNGFTVWTDTPCAPPPGCRFILRERSPFLLRQDARGSLIVHRVFLRAGPCTGHRLLAESRGRIVLPDGSFWRAECPEDWPVGELLLPGLPGGWTMDAAPLGRNLPDLETWFAHAIDRVAEKTTLLEPDRPMPDPRLPACSEVLNHAYLLASRLPSPPARPIGLANRADYANALRNLLDIMCRDLGPGSAGPAPGVSALLPHPTPSAPSSAELVTRLIDALDTWERLHRNHYHVMTGAVSNPWQLRSCRVGNADLLSRPEWLTEADQASLRAQEQGRAHVYREAEDVIAAVEAHGDAAAVMLEQAGLDSSPLLALLEQRDGEWIGTARHALRRLATRIAAGVAGTESSTPTTDTDTTPPDEAAAAEPSQPRKLPPENSLVREGGVWRVTFEGNSTAAPVRLKGWEHLAKLLAHPHTPVASLDLEGHPPDVLPRRQTDDVRLDQQAIREIRDKIQQHKAEMEELSPRVAQDDPDAEKEYQTHLDAFKELQAELKTAVRPGGRSRKISCGNQAAKATGRVKSALNVLKTSMRESWGMSGLAVHLDEYLTQEGTGWAYRPQPADTRWRVETLNHQWR
jgi:hypothetical protein